MALEVPFVFNSIRCSVGNPLSLLDGFSGFLPLLAHTQGNSISFPL